MKIKKVVVIGSGPIIIGQAAEFDYSGSQCLKTLRERGIETVIVNSNPATIMTDKEMADTVYMEPLTPQFLKKILIKENPDALICSFGGQTALNLAKDLYEEGFLQRENIKVLGTDIDSIMLAEDRLLFRDHMIEQNIPVADGIVVNNVEDGLSWAKLVNYPVIVRPAYTLGGTGGGIVNNESELKETLSKGILESSVGECLLEISIKGLKEVEFEVIRDHLDNCVSVCHMENIDPVGVHTGDSVVVAPCLTLRDQEVQMLRSISFQVVRSLNIIGACNVQLALNSETGDYYVIEVNPRVSRSSALASKATGYPIAQIATHVVCGESLDKIVNPITGKTYAIFEPSLDYVILKMPRWPFDKFSTADRGLGTQMKSTGEVMAIGRNFEESWNKALRSLELKPTSFYRQYFDQLSKEQLKQRLTNLTDQWVFEIFNYIEKGASLSELIETTGINTYFLRKFMEMSDAEKEWKNSELDKKSYKKMKELGYSNYDLAVFKNISTDEIQTLQETTQTFPVVKTVDSCAAEFPAQTPYYYTSYDQFTEFEASDKKKVAIIGSGPIRIGQGVEFDYSCVHSLLACQELGYETIMINNNPETCSTDFSLSDRLYFEPLDIESVENILKLEKPEGVILQFGGQTAINLAQALSEKGYTILGTDFDNIKLTEDREEFEKLLDQIKVKRPKGLTLTSLDDADHILEKLEFPVMARPSFVLGGMSMKVLHDQEDFHNYLKNSDLDISKDKPLLLDEYIKGKEIEVDALCDGDDFLIPGIMEHIERAGVHSGDSMAVYPPQNLYPRVVFDVVETTRKIARALSIKGIFNIQFTYKKGSLYILEVNPRASRTVPFLSKMTGIPMAKVATSLSLGKKLRDFDYGTGLANNNDLVSVKLPVFSFEKLRGVEPALGPEMKSTGEVIGIDKNYSLALYKGLLAQGVKIPEVGSILITVSDRYKEESLKIAQGFSELGFRLYATPGTAKFFRETLDIEVIDVPKRGEAAYTLEDMIKDKKIDLIFNTLSSDKKSNTDGFMMRRLAFEFKIPCFTSIDTIEAVHNVYKYRHMGVKGWS